MLDVIHFLFRVLSLHYQDYTLFIIILSYTYSVILIVNIMYYVYSMLYFIEYIGIATHEKYTS